jgi:hypothetical protein
MKKLIIMVVCGIILPLIMAFTSFKQPRKVKVLELKSKPIVEINPTLEIKVEEIEYKGHNEFLDAIGHRESGNRYHIVNKFGYMGKYQFGKSTLRGLGFKITQDEFLNSPYIQEKAMQELLLHNRKKLDKWICKYQGKELYGILITESGVLAAAHLAGEGNVRKFFKKGYEFKDGFGTKMTTYMETFSGYNLNL